MDVPAVVAALVTVVLWGSAFVAIRDAGRTLAPGALALGRLLVSLVVLGAAAYIWREPLPARRDLLRLAAFGVLWLGVYSFALNAAEHRVDAGTAAMVINTGPILIAVLAGFFLREGFPRWLFVGCAVAFAGVVLIGVTKSDSSRSGLGFALLIIAAVAYATAVVIQKSVLARVTPLQVTWLGCAAGRSPACRSRRSCSASWTTPARRARHGWSISVSARPRSGSRPTPSPCGG
jgi:drug/metabolite transporter (DMT)-like permease